ncbi:hypothetical protein GYY_04455 [Methanococcus maripaludis X1]|jgi:hypothetical protein|uniref:Nucleoid-associated protein n=1 Tax=Methanococcus maripaludis X1 TaxID=1053692 RepID=G0GZN5_METMI|nr:nucleoid-associated protein [Methanococcus maripaludis]AEK19766.1 hypothetical protein GYY_04455 [Methanococcus maripaludis X1]
MTELLRDITLDRIIVHQIYQNLPDESRAPTYSDNFEEINDEGRQALENRLKKVLNKESKRMDLIISNDMADSTFQKMAYLSTYKSNSSAEGRENPEFWNDYIDITKQITRKLHDSQNHPNIPGGVVVIMTGRTGAERRDFAAVIKAEIEDGFELDEGELTYIPKLLLTATQKLYKVGIFIDTNPEGRNTETNIRNKDDFKAFVFDDNISKGAKKSNAAEYFYDSFLGCSLEDPAEATKTFLSSAKEVISGLPISPEEKVLAVNKVHVYLSSNTSEINAREFVETYIEEERQDEFLDKLEEKGVPLHSVPKDIGPIKRKLQSRTLSFSSGVQLKFSFEETQEPVEIVESTEEHTLVKIRGKLNKQ